MNLVTILILSVTLAMDAFSVSVASGVVYKKLNLAAMMRIAIFFGLFQAIMPIIGWLLGLSFRGYIAAFDHWIAFGLLSAIGLKMIWEAISNKDTQREEDSMPLKVLLTLSVATSIDALAVGLSFSLLDNSIIFAAVCIGAVTFAMSLVGVMIGKKFGHIFEDKIEIIAGLGLIAIAFKILFEHI